MRNAILIIPFLIVAFCAADYNVIGFSMSFSNDSTTTEIITDGPTDIKTIELKNPDRLIIDLIGGVHRLSTDGLPPLPKSVVVDMRSAQFQAKPEPITRIVLVLAEPVGDLRIENGPRGGKVIIPTPGYPHFDHWSIGRETPGATPEQRLPETVGEETTATTGTGQVSDTTKPSPDTAVTAVTFTDSSGSDISFIRPKVDYLGTEYRDPFVVAEPRVEREFGAEAIPTVEDLILVGIVKDEKNDFLGVLQDRNGWGYILGTEDSVVDGIVGEVTDSTIRFDIEEFGVTRPVNLELIKEKE